MRQIRIRGRVVLDPPEVSRADFLARPPASRQMALTRRQSSPLASPEEIDAALDRALRELEDEPLVVPEQWCSLALQPDSVEFLQGSRDRRHLRLEYRRSDRTWARQLLWP